MTGTRLSLEEARSTYQKIIAESPHIDQFIRENPLQEREDNPRRVESYWRGGNDIYVLEGKTGKYVLKRINQPTGAAEIEYHRKLSDAYPALVPKIFAQDGRTYVMEYVGKRDMKGLLTRPFEESCPALEKAAHSLFKIYSSAKESAARASAVHQIKYTEKYKKFGPADQETEFRSALAIWEQPLREYPARLIHNDLNSLNFRFREDDTICAIDSRADVEGIQDFSKDIGRALASLISAALDNRYSAEQCIALGTALIRPWGTADSELASRTAFYVTQSWFSFSRWDTPRFKKEGFWEMGLDMLKRSPKGFETLDEVVRAGVEGFVKFGREV